MGSLRRRLDAGEDIVLDVRPHWWQLAGPVAVVAAVIAGAVTALVEGVSSWLDWLVLAVLIVSALWLLRRYVQWATTRLVLTSSRIIERRGVLARVEREIPLGALTVIDLRRSLFQRIIGAGDLEVGSAGRDGVDVFRGLPRPGAVRDDIYQQMETWRAGGSMSPPAGRADGGGSPVPGQHPASIPEQIDQLDRLRRRGVISEREFAVKKAELLDRL